jgi:hypothetical protein
MTSSDNDRILIYDIETYTPDGVPDPSKDEIRVLGCYSYETRQYYLLTDPIKIRSTFEYHHYLVGFNNFEYDNMVLSRYYPGMFAFSYNEEYNRKMAYFKYKINVDLLKIFRTRVGIIKVNRDYFDNILLKYDLDTIARTIGVTARDDGKIKGFDYSILKKTRWTDEEWQKISRYTVRDLEITKKMYEWLEEYFESFKDFLDADNVRRKAYLKASPSSFAYKALCRHLGLIEEYEDVKENEDSYGGGYVAYPAGESFDDSQGDIYLFDFKSLYPHVNIQCNLFSPANKGWNGNGAFKVEGVYNDTLQGEIEEFLQQTYKLREEYKKQGDPREYALKIILNAIYGISSTPKFVHVYREHTASDCTALGRQWIQLARKKFREAGYVNIFSDTDSVCVLDKHRDKKRLMALKDSIVEEIKANVPFPSDTFDMGIDAEIAKIWFFRSKQAKKDDDEFMDEDDHVNKKKALLKKNYVYLTKEGDLVVKGLAVKKKSASLLSRHIFQEVLVLKIKQERKIKFPREYIRQLVSQLLEENLDLATVRYAVRASESYKKDSQLHAQIAKEHGPGIHFLIPNYQIGVGKEKKYCTVEEFRKHGLSVSDIDLSNVWRELDYFIEEDQLNFLAIHYLKLAHFIRRPEEDKSIPEWVIERLLESVDVYEQKVI